MYARWGFESWIKPSYLTGSQNSLAGVLPEISGYFHPPSSVYEKKRTPAPEPGDRKRNKHIPFTFNLKEGVLERMAWKMLWRRKKLESASESCWQSKKAIKKLGRAEGSIVPYGLCTTAMELCFPENSSHPPIHSGVLGKGLWTGSQASVYIYRAHLKTKDVELPFNLFTEIIPPAMAMKKRITAAGVILHTEYFHIWRGFDPKMFTKSRANYWLYHKNCLLAQHFVASGYSDWLHPSRNWSISGLEVVDHNKPLCGWWCSRDYDNSILSTNQDTVPKMKQNWVFLEWVQKWLFMVHQRKQ